MKLPLAFSRRVGWAGTSPISFLMGEALANPGLISLAAGFVDQDSLPIEPVRAVVAELLADADQGLKALQYGTTIGDAPLRRLLCDHLARLDGIEPAAYGVTPERMILGAGSQELIYLLAEVLLDPGDVVIVGVPNYFVYLEALESFGVHIVGVPTDKDGLTIDEVDSALRRLEENGDLGRVKLIYDVTYYNNPTGISLARHRRQPLVELAQRWSRTQRILVLEDAAYRELSYSEELLPSVLSCDPAGDMVIYAGSFSKSFSPGLRAGYLVAPRDLIRPMLSLKGNKDFGSPNFVFQVLAAVIASGGYHRHVKRLRDLYRAKAAAVLETLDEELKSVADRVTWTHPTGGMHLWMTLPDGVSGSRTGELFQRCIKAGVLFVPGEHCYPRTYTPIPTNCLRMSFGKLPPDELREGVRRFAEVLRAILTGA